MLSHHRLPTSYAPTRTRAMLGIVSMLKPHKLAWLLNKCAALKLRRRAENAPHTEALAVAFFYATEHMSFSLVKNGLVTEEGNTLGYVVDALRKFDFLLLVEDKTQTFEGGVVCEGLRATRMVQYVAILPDSLWRQHHDRFVGILEGL